MQAVNARTPHRSFGGACVLAALLCCAPHVSCRLGSAQTLRATRALDDVAYRDAAAPTRDASSNATPCETQIGSLFITRDRAVLHRASLDTELAQLSEAQRVELGDSAISSWISDLAPNTHAQFARWWSAVGVPLARCLSTHSSAHADSPTTRIWARIDSSGAPTETLATDDSPFSRCAREALLSVHVGPTGVCRAIWVAVPGQSRAWLRTPSGERWMARIGQHLPVAVHQFWLFEPRDGVIVALPEGPLALSPRRADEPPVQVQPFDEDKWRDH